MKQWLRARWQDWTSNCKGYFVNIFGTLVIKIQPHRRHITMSTDYRRDFSISLLHLLTFDILMQNGLLVSGQMLICYSAHILITQRLTDGVCECVCVIVFVRVGVGVGARRYHWPSSPPHQLHQQHATCIRGPQPSPPVTEPQLPSVQTSWYDRPLCPCQMCQPSTAGSLEHPQFPQAKGTFPVRPRLPPDKGSTDDCCLGGWGGE